MLSVYLFGAAVSFCMLLFIFLKSRPWEESTICPDSPNLRRNVVIISLFVIMMLSSFSWLTVLFLFRKRFTEIRDGI